MLNKIKINRGCKIALISPSKNPKKRKDVDDICNLIKKRGYIPVVSDNIMNQNLEDRLNDIHQYFSDSSIEAIFNLRGGFNCNMLLDSIDYDLIKSNPKVFLGFSDITNLSIAFLTKSKMPTFHGALFSELSFLSENILNNIFDLLESDNWNINSINEIELTMLKSSSMKSIGEIIGGNLFVINNLIGTKYEPEWKDNILFIESVGLPIEIILTMIEHLKQIGVFEKLSGLIIGNCGTQDENISKNQIIERLKEFDFPVLGTDNIGHVMENYTIPIGVNASIVENKIRIIPKSPPK